jgi:hypothetical protein
VGIFPVTIAGALSNALVDVAGRPGLSLQPAVASMTKVS